MNLEISLLLGPQHGCDGELFRRILIHCRALKAPSWARSWNIGVRLSETKLLVAFISGIPETIRICNKSVYYMYTEYALMKNELTTATVPLELRRSTFCALTRGSEIEGSHHL